MDRDAFDYLANLEGENSMAADRLRREASNLRSESDRLEKEAAWYDERKVWCAEALKAMNKGNPE